MPANELKPCPTMGSDCRGCPDCPGASSTGLKSGDVTNEAARKEIESMSELSKPAGNLRKQPDDSYWPLPKNTATMNMVQFYSQEYISALLDVAIALREWIDAVPDEVAASLPTMPGIDRDWVDSVIGKGNRNG